MPARGPGDQGLPVDDRLSLADCDIQPAGTPIAYRGWLTLGDLFAAGSASPGAGTPVYALVTEGPAEWVGWQTTEGRPMYPRPVGRMACAVGPLSGDRHRLQRGRWMGAAGAHGRLPGFPDLPVRRRSPGRWPIGLHPAAVRRRGMVVEDRDRAAGADRSLTANRARITARAMRLDGSRAMSLPVDSPPIPESQAAHLEPLSLGAAGALPRRTGCWLVSVAVDGVGVGAAIVPVTAPAG